MTLHHANVVVGSLERALAFYVGLLGMKPVFSVVLEGTWFEELTGQKGASARCAFVRPSGGGCRIELLEYAGREGVPVAESTLPSVRGLRHLALEVEDLDATYARLLAAGVPFLSPPAAVPFRLVDGIQKRLCYCRDPDGTLVELCAHETVRAAPPAP